VQQCLEGTNSQDGPDKHLNTKNLLYVACSRAIKNLRVLYLDDIKEIRIGIEAIFGEAKHWPVEM
jgi:DNA helicase-2/ATP-dependent DNA helicase PcrA